MTDTPDAPTVDELPQFAAIQDHIANLVSLHAFLWEWRSLLGPVDVSPFSATCRTTDTAAAIVRAAALEWESALVAHPYTIGGVTTHHIGFGGISLRIEAQS